MSGYEEPHTTIDARVLEKVNDVEKKQVEQSVILDSIKGTLDKIDQRVERIDYTINGNGTPGLKSRIQAAEQDIQTFKAQQDRSDRRGWEKYLTVRNFVFAVIGGGTLYIVKDVISFLKGVAG